MTKKNKKPLAVCLFIVAIIGISIVYQLDTQPSTFGRHGSASELEGNTVILSLFISDSNGTWEGNARDIALEQDMLDYLGIATDWISHEAKAYNTKCNFIYDWSENSDLRDFVQVDYDMTKETADKVLWKHIDENIDYVHLQEKYNAENILFVAFLDTPKSLDDTSQTRFYYPGMTYPYEICYIFAHCDGDKESPASIAHEILHAYGAPDLYYSDSDYGITENYVQKLEKENSNDIMFRTYDDNDNMVYDRITNEFTELDAYYVGISPQSNVKDKWGFSEGEHSAD